MISERLGLPLQRVIQVLDFLVDAELCIQEGHSYRMGPSSTHIGWNEPLVYRHHQNWREQSLAHLRKGAPLAADELCVTIPCSLSTESQEKVRRILLETLEKIVQIIDADKEEHLAYLNIDLFRL